ncbi:MAG TPA: Amuc_1100 family pilus-like protein [Candidatus Sulfotelmatobacter sp.]|jgi:hypothetical protein|nr:Amuc_1100 family pilus-like protein [Candidatus Sulfotelmatobacter sp.]
MGWIKRNLFFVIGGILALGLLGAAGYYIWASWSNNAKAFDDLTQVVQNLKSLNDQKPSPGNDRNNNIQNAKDQEKQLRDWLASSANNFQPIDPIPQGQVTGANFSGALQSTLGQLRHEADAAGVLLPPKFDFSFTAEGDRMTFTPSGLGPLAEQLGEVAAISRILYAARVNAFDGIQRVRASDDDASGQPSDYIDYRPVTNELAIIEPYVITFRAFTPELAAVLSDLATAKNAFIVKAVTVTRADNSGAAGPVGGDQPSGMPPVARGPGEFPQPASMPGMMPPAAGRGGLQTVLKEQLLHITLEVQIVKLLPSTPPKS